MRSLLTAALFIAAAPLAFSHGIWIAERVDEHTIVYGHGADDEAYDSNKITYVQVFDKNAFPTDIRINKRQKNVGFDSNAEFSSVAVVMDNGYWSKDGQGKWINRPKNEVDSVEESSHSIKTALGITDHGKLPTTEALSKLPLILLPQSDIMHSKIGSLIEVAVYYQGKSLPGAEIIADYVGDSDTVVAKTDAQGKASIAIRNQGLNVLATHFETEAKGDEKEKADKVSYTATLSFVNARHHH